MALFKIFKDKTGRFRFLLKSNKNQIIFTSKGYSSRLICFSQIQLIKRYALKDEKYERHISQSDSPYFTFKVFKSLAKSGILIRRTDIYEIKNSLRVTIGKSDENKKIINKLKDIIDV